MQKGYQSLIWRVIAKRVSISHIKVYHQELESIVNAKRISIFNKRVIANRISISYIKVYHQELESRVNAKKDINSNMKSYCNIVVTTKSLCTSQCVNLNDLVGSQWEPLELCNSNFGMWLLKGWPFTSNRKTSSWNSVL